MEPPEGARLARQVPVRLTSRDVEAMAEIGHLAAEQGDPTELGEAILECLRSVAPFDVAHISYWDPFRGEHVTLFNRWYDDPYLRFLNAFSEKDWGYRLVREARWPGRGRDLPIPVTEHPIYDYYKKYGYADGMTVCLFTHDGRYTGLLDLNTSDPRHPSDRARLILGLLTRTLATVTDVTRPYSRLVSVIEPDASAVAVSKDGTPIELPGHENRMLLDELSPVVMAAWRLLERDPHGPTLLWRNRTGTWLRIRILRVRGLVAEDDEHAVVAVRATTVPYGLTARELDVLTLMADGASNARVARELFTSPHTVITHVEHIFEKLGQGCRAGAVAVALREGLLRLRPESLLTQQHTHN